MYDDFLKYTHIFLNMQVFTNNNTINIKNSDLIISKKLYDFSYILNLRNLLILLGFFENKAFTQLPSF